MQYKAEVEITNFNIRIKEIGGNDESFKAAINCVVADHRTAIIKGLSPDGLFKPEMAILIRNTIHGMGYELDWKSKGKDFGMSHKLHNPKEAKSDDDHIDFAIQSLTLLGYKVEKTGVATMSANDIHIRHFEGKDGAIHVSGSWTLNPIK